MGTALGRRLSVSVRLDGNATASAFHEYDTYGSVRSLWSVSNLEKSDSNHADVFHFFQQMIQSTLVCESPALNTFLYHFVKQNFAYFDHNKNKRVEFPDFESLLFVLASIEARMWMKVYSYLLI